MIYDDLPIKDGDFPEETLQLSGDSTSKSSKLPELQVWDGPSVQPAQNPSESDGWVWSSTLDNLEMRGGTNNCLVLWEWCFNGV